jgi:phosphoglycolate phosphatase-like HAD superfamily hydrolase
LLASSCASDEIDRYKGVAGISNMTDCDVTADDASSKPAPDNIHESVDQIAPIVAYESCVVGDTKYDGEAARQAGILSSASMRRLYQG